MDPIDRAIRVIGYTIAGPCIGAMLGIVAFALVGGFFAILAADWRHIDALAEVAAKAYLYGLVLGTWLGVPIGAPLGLVIGVILAFRTPAACSASAPAPKSCPSGNAGKPGGPFDDW